MDTSSWVDELWPQVGASEAVAAALAEVTALTGESGSAWVDRHDRDLVKVYRIAAGVLHLVEGSYVVEEETAESDSADAIYRATPIARDWEWKCRVERAAGAQEDVRSFVEWVFYMGVDQPALSIEYEADSDDPAALFARRFASEITEAQARGGR
jgi:hypothetical protein